MTVHTHGARPYEWVGAWSERRAALTPDRVGLVDATTGTEYTYADLDARANRAARLLADHGVTRAAGAGDGAGDAGARVAVVSRNRPELVDLFFATAKTGGVLAPLSHRLAARELVQLLNDVDPALLVVEEPFADLVAETLAREERAFDAPVLALPTDAVAGDAGDASGEDGGPSDGDGENPVPDVADAAYADALPDDDAPFDGPDLGMDDPHLFLHTGGSTGVPKETVLTHGGVCWNSFNTITAWGLRPDDVTPMPFPMFHTGGWNVLTVPFFHMGAEVVVAREFDPGQVLSLVADRGATVLVAVPVVLREMCRHDDWADTDLSTLRFAKSGGGPCRESVMESWWDRGVDLSQGYGLTECGPNNFAMPEEWPPEKADTVGKPVPHVDARVVDGDGDPVPQGDIGELELASPHAADRYWRNETETAATFGAAAEGSDGDAADGEARAWVSTGDLARVDADGYYSIEGRKKTMFVSGGENVYPAEVEDVVAGHPKVEEVVVVGVPDETWGEVGKAVVQGDDSLTLEELTEHVEGKLARFKRPRHLAFVEEMPMSGPSKIDREAVKERFGGDAA